MSDNAALTADAPAIEVQLPEELLRLQLDHFEGPFEVLLYLIRNQEIDIFDIPIMQITEQYLQFLDLMHAQSLDIAGDFLVMAATLIQIKSRMILPVEAETEEEEVEEEDPRIELVEKLLEYRKFRDLAVALGDYEARQADCFHRAVKPEIEAVEDDDEIIDVSLFDLIKAIRSILKYVFDPAVHEVRAEGASVDEKIAYIQDHIRQHESITWTELFRSCRSKTEVVCCLLAILELCHMKRIRAHQYGLFGEIRLFAREAAPEEAEGEEGE